MSERAIDLQHIAELIAGLPRSDKRCLIGVAGPPASGKSTFATTLASEICARGRAAKVVPMDGFHLDNDTLTERGLLDVKGAPETFDADGFIDLVKNLQVLDATSFPTFDRAADATVPDGDQISEATDIAIVEGNYLLLSEQPWANLAALWDISIWLNVPLAVLKSRLADRWCSYGYALDAARRKAHSNDIPNGQRLINNRLPADYVISDN